MEIARRIHCANRKSWRAWLSRNYARVNEVWLVFYKKHTGKASVAYGDSVEEALCFGWIDGLKRRIDDESYAYRFTPRRPGSRWSPLNISLAERLIRQKMMTRAGLRAFENRRGYDEASIRAREYTGTTLTPELESGLRANKLAWKNFTALAPGYRRQYVLWLRDAKREETRRRRLREAIRLLKQNRKLGMK
jgi:uncharacterized protein YdeI (YjbR/CyaY-like superfamily)